MGGGLTSSFIHTEGRLMGNQRDRGQKVKVGLIHRTKQTHQFVEHYNDCNYCLIPFRISYLYLFVYSIPSYAFELQIIV